MPRFILVVAALGLGFVLGWLAHRPKESPLATPAPTGATAPATVTAPEVAAARTVAPLAAAAPETEPRDERHARIDTLKWLRSSGVPVHLQVFHGFELNDSLTKMLDLNAAEKSRITEAARSTLTQIENARAATAVPRLSPDGTSLIVEVPALDPSASGAIYDGLRHALESTLGPERMEVFNELAGEAFERSFDRFGLNAVRYEVSPPRALDNSPIRFVEFKRHFVDATGSSTGWGSGRFIAGEIAKGDSLLAKILPPGFESGTAPP